MKQRFKNKTQRTVMATYNIGNPNSPENIEKARLENELRLQNALQQEQQLVSRQRLLDAQNADNPFGTDPDQTGGLGYRTPTGVRQYPNHSSNANRIADSILYDVEVAKQEAANAKAAEMAQQQLQEQTPAPTPTNPIRDKYRFGQ